MLKKILYSNNTFIISSIENKGCYIGRFKGLGTDADGNWIICADIDKESITEIR